MLDATTWVRVDHVVRHSLALALVPPRPVDLAGLGVLSTADAARLLAREPATLQRWAVTGGPLAPIRINGRLGWRIADIQRLLTVAA